tara:strand:- start:327 stop:584 length:258 start_codon:yes stop_codon:yes gene_type:complete
MADRALETVLALLDRRGPGKTICPSEAARALAGESGEWRAHMDAVHMAVDRLADEGRVALSWKGEALYKRDGPYRIALASPNASP